MSVKRTPADIEFSKAIREKYNYVCCNCQKDYRHDPGYMDCAHIVSRKNRRLRWDAHYGALALCKPCHRHFTDHPLDWADFVKRYWGSDNYDEAKRLGNEIRKYSKVEQKEIAAHYRAQTKYMERLRREGKTGILPLVSYD